MTCPPPSGRDRHHYAGSLAAIQDPLGKAVGHVLCGVFSPSRCQCRSLAPGREKPVDHRETEMTTNTPRVPRGNDIANCLLDLEGIGALLLDVAASIDAGSVPSTRSLYFLGASVRDCARTLADDLGMKMFQAGGEDQP